MLTLVVFTTLVGSSVPWSKFCSYKVASKFLYVLVSPHIIKSWRPASCLVVERKEPLFREECSTNWTSPKIVYATPPCKFFANYCGSWEANSLEDRGCISLATLKLRELILTKSVNIPWISVSNFPTPTQVTLSKNKLPPLESILYHWINAASEFMRILIPCHLGFWNVTLSSMTNARQLTGKRPKSAPLFVRQRSAPNIYRKSCDIEDFLLHYKNMWST